MYCICVFEWIRAISASTIHLLPLRAGVVGVEAEVVEETEAGVHQSQEEGIELNTLTCRYTRGTL